MSKVLIVDDSAEMREVIRIVLEQDGHEVIEAEDGDAGIGVARSAEPDLIILDMNMPKMTGWEVAPVLRSHPKTRRTPIIAVTGDLSTQGRESAHEAGCNYFVTKPFAPERLMQAVGAALDTSRPVPDVSAKAERDRPKRVLIADDDWIMRSLLSELVTSAGAEVIGEAEDGNQAIEIFRRQRPDLAILDVNMPVRDGVSALKRIVAETPDAKIVMLSANDDVTVAESCLYFGARNYINKSAAPNELLTSIRAVLGLEPPAGA
ncbi:MAG: response regulator [Rhodospirillales bacterium]